jgi:hypothetical protein
MISYVEFNIKIVNSLKLKILILIRVVESSSSSSSSGIVRWTIQLNEALLEKVNKHGLDILNW